MGQNWGSGSKFNVFGSTTLAPSWEKFRDFDIPDFCCRHRCDKWYHSRLTDRRSSQSPGKPLNITTLVKFRYMLVFWGKNVLASNSWIFYFKGHQRGGSCSVTLGSTLVFFCWKLMVPGNANWISKSIK